MNIVAPAVVKRYAKGTDSDASDAMIVNALDRKGGGADDNDAQAGHLVAGTVRSHQRPGSNSFDLVSHTLRAEGFDASEDGTGRGTPLTVDRPACGCLWEWIDGDGFCACCHAHLNDSQGLYAEQGDGSHQFAGCPAAQPQTVDPLVSRSSRGKATPLAPGHNTDSHVAVSDGLVRRLSPSECEALQGFPRGWTLLEPDTDWGSYPQPDGRRYSAMGDAVTVNVAHWIGRRLLQAVEREPTNA